MSNIQQMVIYPVPGGNLVIHRLGSGFHVIVDCPEGVVSMPIEWVNRRRAQLHRISVEVARLAAVHGKRVSVCSMTSQPWEDFDHG